MVCKNASVNASFAFALLSELILLSLFILHLLRTFRLAPIPPTLLGNLVSVSAPIFLVFGIICLAALGADCIEIATATSIVTFGEFHTSRLMYGFEWGILDILLAACLITFILVRVLAHGQGLLFKDDAAHNPKEVAAAGAAATSPMQPQPYAQPGAQPQYAQPGAQPQYAQPGAQPQYAQPPQPQYAQPTPAPVYAQPVSAPAQPAQYAPPPTSGV